MDDDNDNTIVHNEPDNAYDFKYNFIDTPWDDRTMRSKIGIVSLLVSIFVATIACVSYNIAMHYTKTHPAKSLSGKFKCHLVKVDEYKFVARIHSLGTDELLCVGAVLSINSVITNGICVKAGPIRLRLGSPTDPRCKKGFSVDVIEPIFHEGTVSKHLVLLSSSDSMADCAKAIKIGDILNWSLKVDIIGRPLHGTRSLSRQPASLARVENITGLMMKSLNMRSTICVIELVRCPVRAGDLLVQNRRVFGLASTSTHVTEQSKLVCFADLRIIEQEIKEHDHSIAGQFL